MQSNIIYLLFGKIILHRQYFDFKVSICHDNFPDDTLLIFWEIIENRGISGLNRGYIQIILMNDILKTECSV